MDRVQVLEAENDALRERIWQLEELMGYHWSAPTEFHLTGKEEAILGCLMAKPLATKEMLYHTLYALHEEPPEQKIIDVFICKLRPKLRPWKIEIETVWGRGYSLNTDAKQRIRAMVEARDGRQQADPTARQTA